MASSCGGFPIRSDFDHQLKKLLVAVQTKREVNRSHDVTTGDLEDLQRTAGLFRKVVPLLRVELNKLRAKLLGVEAVAVGQTNPFLDTEAGAPKRKKKVVTFTMDQQTNPFLAGGRMEVETNPFVQPAVELSGAGATLPDRKLLEAGVTMVDRKLSETEATLSDRKLLGAGAMLPHQKLPEAEAMLLNWKPLEVSVALSDQKLTQGGAILPNQKLLEARATLTDWKLLEAGVFLTDQKLSEAGATLTDRKLLEAESTLLNQQTPTAAIKISPEAVSEQASVPERKKKVITFAVNQQRPMVVQIAPEVKAQQSRAPVKVDQQIAVSSLTAGKTAPTMLRAANKFGRTRRRSRSRPSLPPQAKPDTTMANQLIEKQVPLPLPPCYYCDGKHALCRCSWFKVLHLSERLDFVQRMKLCNNCFSQQHSASNCRNEPRCWLCTEWHHTLLHRTLFIPKQSDVVGSKSVGMV